MIRVRAGPVPYCGQYGVGQRLKIRQPMAHHRTHIYELEMWQQVEELASWITLAVQFELSADDIRDPAVSVAIEMWTHVSENGIRHVRMGFHPRLCRAGQLSNPEVVPRDLLGPLRCMCRV